MKKNLTEIVFILDRSGSMHGLEADTIGGFNSMIEKQKKETGEALVSTILFDNAAEVIHDRVSLKDIRELTSRDYCVKGCTALLDAVGGAILLGLKGVVLIGHGATSVEAVKNGTLATARAIRAGLVEKVAASMDGLVE